jgi:AhpD family alkylhydroperoxidase
MSNMRYDGSSTERSGRIWRARERRPCRIQRVTLITEAQSHETSGDSLRRRREAPEEEADMPDTVLYPSNTRELAHKRRELSPDTEAAFQAFSQKVFAAGALPEKVKQIIAVAVAHVTQCPYCIKGHTKAALRHGASPEELMEAIWVAAEMRAGGTYAHSILAIEEIEKAAATTAA